MGKFDVTNDVEDVLSVARRVYLSFSLCLSVCI